MYRRQILIRPVAVSGSSVIKNLQEYWEPNSYSGSVLDDLFLL